MATFKILLDKRRVKKDGSYPLVVRFYHESKSFSLSTNIQLQLKHWDEASIQVRKSHPQHQELNQRIRKLQLEYTGRIIGLYKQVRTRLDINSIKSEFTGIVPAPVTVKSFWENEIWLLEKSKRYGNARTHRISLEVFQKITDINIPFENINYSFLKNVEDIFQQRELKINSIGVYMRNLRVIYNIAVKKDIVEFHHYPFKKYKIKSEKSVPHVLSKDELIKLFSLKLNKQDKLYKTLILAKLSFLLAGINFHDLVLLNEGNIKQGRLVYKRAKTKKIYSLIILSETRKLIEEISLKNSSTLCNILNNDELRSEIKLPYIIREKNKQFNKNLSKLSELLCFTKIMRSYTFRYSIANLCKQLGYDIGMISELLGHNYGSNVTSGYLEAINKDALDSMLYKVYSTVSKLPVSLPE